MNKLDQKNKKIIFELSQNSRQTNKQIAKKVGLSEVVVGYRIKKLIENKIINYFYIRFNPALLKYFHYKVFLRTKPLTGEKEIQFINTIKNNKNVLWFVSTRGNYDYVLSLLVKDIHEFSKVYNEIIENFSDQILQRNVSIVEMARTFSRGYLQNKISQEFKHAGKEKKVELDKDDFKLLNLISINVRKTGIEIAKKMNISADKVIYRLKKIQKNNLITGFGLSLNLKKLGMKQYLIALKMQNMSLEKYNQLKEIARKNQSLQYFVKIIGDREVDLELEITTDEQLDQLFNEIKLAFVDELREYEILEITTEHKLNYFPF